MNSELLVFGGPFDGTRKPSTNQGEYTIFPLNRVAVDFASGRPRMSREESLAELTGPIEMWAVYVHELRDTGYGLHFVANVTDKQLGRLSEVSVDQWPMLLAEMRS